ncbi:hypothetical protein GQ55_1G367000 [Panicum hallii var. hallii]|uniref:Tyrosine-protein phosphatase domain-containing protein n=1 Tax=Panicum hallii var. hallii TaxID=1504633 RepID=A0A2T7FBD9_9POAL|nr:hypothetical protein GQ55_1G367000 [Panicum hallii var. hallii]
MRKRERENPCGICGHYHKFEEGEVCGVCGHRWKTSDGEGTPARHESAFPTEVLKDFLFLGSYDNASRSEVLKTLGISRILNNSFTYHSLQRDRPLDFDGAIQFLEQCERDKSRVLVHCMSGKNRSAAIVAAFLMNSRAWRLAQSLQWVKDRRPQVQLTDASRNELLEYEQKLFGLSAEPVIPTESFASLGFGYTKPADDTQAPAFNQMTAPSIFQRVGPNDIPANFAFGAERTVGVNPQDSDNNGGTNPASTDNVMDSS